MILIGFSLARGVITPGLLFSCRNPEADTAAILLMVRGVWQAGELKRNNLKIEGLIEYPRDFIRLLDLKGLKEYSCKCYKAVNDEFDRLLGAIGVNHRIVLVEESAYYPFLHGCIVVFRLGFYQKWTSLYRRRRRTGLEFTKVLLATSGKDLKNLIERDECLEVKCHEQG